MGLLSRIVELFEEGVAVGKCVLEVRGSDVEDSCDDLIKDSKTYAHIYQESVIEEHIKSIKSMHNEKKKKQERNIVDFEVRYNNISEQVKVYENRLSDANQFEKDNDTKK